MKAAPIKRHRNAGVIRVGYVVLVGVILLPLVAVIGVTSYIRLGSDAAALRNSVIKIAPAKARVVVNVGWLTTGVARWVAGLFPIPPEAQMAMRSIRGGSRCLPPGTADSRTRPRASAFQGGRRDVQTWLGPNCRSVAR
jgi:hypothetical protein